MSDWLGPEGKAFQDDIKKKGEEGKKAVEDAAEGIKKKAQDAIEAAKQKLDEETIKQIKEIAKRVKEILKNLPLEIPGGVDKLIEKLDEKLQQLDPPDDDPDTRANEVEVLLETITDDLEPLIDELAEMAKRDFDVYFRRLVIMADLLTLIERDLDRIPSRRKGRR